MEKLYHYLWKTKMFSGTLKAAGGEEVTVIDPGHHNTDSGPDFFNSKVRIGSQEWIGNVEIHVKASDWYRHGHQDDPAYDNVILHVVGVSDKKVKRRDGSLIPQVELTFPKKFFSTLTQLSEEMGDLRCSRLLPDIPQLNKTDWIQSLAIARLQAKASKVREYLELSSADWQQACFILFARALGFGLNSDPFEQLARNLPLTILHHHSDNIFQLEAIIFGNAGMLDPSLHIFDEFYQALCREYYFLARKYGLHPMPVNIWKYARTRPGNFPHRRLAMLAKACEGGFSLFSTIIKESSSPEQLKECFRIEPDEYWKNHFSFDRDPNPSPSTLSEGSIRLLIINVAAPLLYAYGKASGEEEFTERAIGILESMPPEDNSFIRRFAASGIMAGNALESQALIHLRKEYCDTKKCLYCRWGNRLLKTAASS